MENSEPMRIILSEGRDNQDPAQQLELFSLVSLGLVQSLASGVLSPTEALQRFYHADNCLYVRKAFRNREANEIMSRGVQLPDLFDHLTAEGAQREFFRELEKMRSLCLKLLEKVQSPRVSRRATA